MALILRQNLFDSTRANIKVNIKEVAQIAYLKRDKRLFNRYLGFTEYVPKAIGAQAAS